MAWEFDATHSLIRFSVKHMMVTTVKGSFNRFSGTLSLDELHPTASTADVTIDAASISTGDNNRDNHLRSPDFFDVATYPTIAFKSTKIEEAGHRRFRITGNLTIRGMTKEVVLDAVYNGQSNRLGMRAAGFTFTTSNNLGDFGMNWNVALESGGVLVGNKVNISIEALAVEVHPQRQSSVATAESAQA